MANDITGIIATGTHWRALIGLTIRGYMIVRALHHAPFGQLGNVLVAAYVLMQGRCLLLAADRSDSEHGNLLAFL